MFCMRAGRINSDTIYGILTSDAQTAKSVNYDDAYCKICYNYRSICEEIFNSRYDYGCIFLKSATGWKLLNLLSICENFNFFATITDPCVLKKCYGTKIAKFAMITGKFVRIFATIMGTQCVFWKSATIMGIGPRLPAVHLRPSPDHVLMGHAPS